VKRQLNFGLGNAESRCFVLARFPMLGPPHEERQTNRSDQVGQVDNEKKFQHPTRPYLAIYPSHHHEIVAREKFGSRDHNEDQTKRKTQSARHTEKPERQFRITGNHCEEHRSRIR
jgi:hypothetical protein